jgi:transposase
MNYPSDITKAQFNKIAPLLEGARKKTKPRILDLYDVFNGLLYVVTTGCQWRALPKDYPKWRSVHNYFSIWSTVPEGETESILSQVLKKNGRMRAYEKWQKTLNEHGYC